MAKDYPPQGAGYESDPENSKGIERADNRLRAREEELGEDKCGGGPEDEEVIPLDRCTYEASDYYLFNGGALPSVLTADSLHDASFP